MGEEVTFKLKVSVISIFALFVTQCQPIRQPQKAESRKRRRIGAFSKKM
jgi:hypothetical protein